MIDQEKLLDFTKIELQKILHKVNVEISNEYMRNISISSFQPEYYISKDFARTIYRLYASFIGQDDLPKIFEVYPANWKEAFKERWAPQWFQKRWPVKYKTISIDYSLIYPYIKIPQEEHRLHYKVVRGTQYGHNE